MTNKIVAKSVRLSIQFIYGLGTMFIMIMGWVQIINLVDNHTVGGLMSLFAFAHAAGTLNAVYSNYEPR